MTLSNLSALSMTALKAKASEMGVVPTGDKRVKQSWIDCLETAQPVSDAEMEMVAHAADVAAETVSDDELSDAEMEMVAHAADVASATVSDVEMEMIAHAADCANDETVTTPTLEGSGAATVMIVILSIAAIFCEACYVVTKALVSLCYYGFTTVRKYYASVNFGTGFLTNYLQT